MNERRWLVIGVMLPVLGIGALIARAELKVRSGQTFRVDITGYDPRDLLHGHYLQYRYAWDWQGDHSCGSSILSHLSTPNLDCCVCLTRRGATEPPSARQVECDATDGCDAWLRGGVVAPPLRYFIPEESAPELEEAFRSQSAAVDLSIDAKGGAAVGELYLDGRPWREVVP